jgi:hypothetical protein
MGALFVVGSLGTTHAPRTIARTRTYGEWLASAGGDHCARLWRMDPNAGRVLGGGSR